MHKRLFRWCLPLLCLIAEAHASGIIATNSDIVGGQLQTCCSTIGFISDQGGTIFWLGLPFTVSGAAQYGDIGFDAKGLQSGAGTTTFDIYDSLNNKPNNSLASTVVNVSTGNFALFSGSFPGLTLNSGQTYYLVGKTTAGQVELQGNTTNSDGPYYQHETVGVNDLWLNPQTLTVPLPAFDITGTDLGAPEPGTSTLGGIALVVAGFLLRRRG